MQLSSSLARGPTPGRTIEVLMIFVGLIVSPYFAKTARRLAGDEARFSGVFGHFKGLYCLSQGDLAISIMYHLWVARFLAALMLPERMYWAFVAPLSTYTLRAVPYAYLLLLGPKHTPTAMAVNWCCRAQLPCAVFLFHLLPQTSAVLELAFVLVGTPITCLLVKWHGSLPHATHLMGLNYGWMLLQGLLAVVANLNIHYLARRQQRQQQRLQQQQQQQQQRQQQQQHLQGMMGPEAMAAAGPQGTQQQQQRMAGGGSGVGAAGGCGADDAATLLQPPDKAARGYPTPPHKRDATAGGSSGAAGSPSPREAGAVVSPVGGCKPLAGAGAPAASEAAAAAASSGGQAAASPTTAAVDAAASAGAPVGAAAAAASAQPQRPQQAAPAQQPARPPPPPPPPPYIAAAAAHAAIAAAPQLDPAGLHQPLPPYRSFVRRTTHFAKIDGLEPEDLPAGWQERLAEVLAQQGRTLTGVYVRRGCVELVVEYVRLPAGAQRGGAAATDASASSGNGNGSCNGGSTTTSFLSWQQLQQLLQLPLPLTPPPPPQPPHEAAGASAVAAAARVLGGAAGSGVQQEAAASAEGGPLGLAPQAGVFQASSTTFHGSVAGAAALAQVGQSAGAAVLAGTTAQLSPPLPRFLSLHPRVALLPPPPQQQPEAHGARAQHAPAAARLLLLSLELWFPPSPGVGADGSSSSSGAAAAGGATVEVLLRHRHRYVPVTVRRLPLSGAPGARKVVAAGVHAASGRGEGRMERYEMDVRLGGGESADALVAPGLLHVDVRWGGLPFMSLPVLLLPSADAAGGGAGVAAAAGPAAVDMAAVAEELQRFCRWFGRRGEAAVAFKAAAAAAHASGSGGGSDSDEAGDEGDEDAAGALLHDLGFVLYGDDGSGRHEVEAGSGAAAAGCAACISPAQRCFVRLLAGREVHRYAHGNGMPHLAGLVAQRLDRLEEELAALGGNSFVSLNSLPSNGDAAAGASVGGDGGGGGGRDGGSLAAASGSSAGTVAVLAATPAGHADGGSDSAAPRGSGSAASGGGSNGRGCSTCRGATSSCACDGGYSKPREASRWHRASAAAAVAAVAWRSLLLFVGLAKEEPEEAAAFREARTAWNLRNAPLMEALEVLMSASVLARYVSSAARAHATAPFTGTFAWIGLVRCGTAFIVSTAPLLLMMWMVQPLLSAVRGVPNEGRAQAVARLQQLRQRVRAGPAVVLRYAALVASKALMLALRVVPPPMWRTYSVGLGLVAAEGLLLPVACLLPPLPALLLSAVRMPVLAAYLASTQLGRDDRSTSRNDSSERMLGEAVCGALDNNAACLAVAAGEAAGASWACAAHAVWLAVRLEAVALAATWACHVYLRLLLQPSRASARRRVRH